MGLPHLYVDFANFMFLCTCIMLRAGSVGPEQQSTEDILDFLSQTSDVDNFGSVGSEPEAETRLMSCYHGIYGTGAVRQCEMSSSEQRAKTSMYVFLPLT